MFSYTTSGSFKNAEAFLENAKRMNIKSILEVNAQRGVDALRAATPRDSGLAAESWGYEISQNGSSWTITWTNRDIENGFPVAIMIQIGYGTGTGGYVRGRDYINPAMRPVFDQIAEQVWKAVTSI